MWLATLFEQQANRRHAENFGCASCIVGTSCEYGEGIEEYLRPAELFIDAKSHGRIIGKLSTVAGRGKNAR